jgi:hypothetical protein
MYALTVADFESWLRGYGKAWEGRDANAAAALFTADADYYWTPFDPPQRGRDHVGVVAFEFDVLAAAGARGSAHWHTRFISVPDGAPVELDGILIAEFAGEGQCRTFREWWHQRSAAG